jgi:hypothetical protein
VALLAVAGAAGAGGEEAFVDYYASASSLINALNTVAADLERLPLTTGDFSEDVAQEMKAQLVKAREGFASLLTYDDRTNDLNEGYLLYLDKMLLALMVAGEYREAGGAERPARVARLVAESTELRAELNRRIQNDKKKYGLD